MDFLKNNLGKILGILGIGAGGALIARISYKKGYRDMAKYFKENLTEIHNNVLIKENSKLKAELQNVKDKAE